MSRDTMDARNILAIYRGPSGRCVDPTTDLVWNVGEGHYITQEDADRLTEPERHGNRWTFEEVPPEPKARSPLGGDSPDEPEETEASEPTSEEAPSGDADGEQNESD